MKAHCPQTCFKAKDIWENQLFSCKIKIFGNFQSFDLSRTYTRSFILIFNQIYIWELQIRQDVPV